MSRGAAPGGDQAGTADPPPAGPVMEALARSGVPDGLLARTAGAVLGRSVGSAESGAWLDGLRGRRRRVAELLLSPGIPQRTPEWYEAREALVTASDLQRLIDAGPEAYCAKKLGSAGAWDAMSRQPAIRWGKKYEPVAASVYSRRTGARLRELGLLLHPRLPGFGASPDGISDDGVMLEIKCPYSRLLVPGAVPQAYATQIQGQLDVAGLDECDFFEARLSEYGTAAEFLADAAPGGEADLLTADGLEKGAMYLAEAGGDWEVCDPGLTASGAADWAQARLAAGGGRGAATFWRVDDTNLVRVSRDPSIVELARPAIGECRAILEAARERRLSGGGARAGGREEGRREAGPGGGPTPRGEAPMALPSMAFIMA